jgi:hypothetical protein
MELYIANARLYEAEGNSPPSWEIRLNCRFNRNDQAAQAFARNRSIRARAWSISHPA